MALEFNYHAGGDYCCTRKCFALKDVPEVDGYACTRCQSYVRCYCGCDSYMAHWRGTLVLTKNFRPNFNIVDKEEEWFDYYAGGEYCCPKQCFSTSSTVVDGLACFKCGSYERCYCDCVTFMTFVKAKISKIKVKPKVEIKPSDMRERFKVWFPDFNYRRPKRYCCEKMCFCIDDGTDEVDGIACYDCGAFGRCYCACVSYRIPTSQDA